MSKKAAPKKKKGPARTQSSSKKRNLATCSISDEPIPDPAHATLPEEIRDRIDDIHHQLTTMPWRVIPELKELIALYPKIRIFRNFLAAAYGAIGDRKNLEAQVLENYRLEPEYFFAQVGYADLCITRGNMEEVPKIFDGKLDLKLLYPKRNHFHTSEFLGLSDIVGRYYCWLGKVDEADMLVKMMFAIAPEHPLTLRLLATVVKAQLKILEGDE